MDSEPGTPAYGLSRSSSQSSGLGLGSGDLPGWIPDAEARHCMACKRAFGFSRRRHHCRNCGWCICSACSPHKMVLSHASSQAQRVCNDCFSNLRQVAQLRQQAIMGDMASGFMTPMRSGSIDASAGFYPPSAGASPAPSSTRTSAMTSHAPAAQHQRYSSTPMQASSLLFDSVVSTPATPASQLHDPYPSPSPTPSPLVTSTPSPNSFPAATPSPARSSPLPSPTNGSGNGGFFSSSSSAAVSSAQMLPLAIPDWTYLFKPFSGAEGAEVSVGRLGVSVMAAVDLPQLDFLFNTAAPYVQVRLGGAAKRTHTLNPPNAAAAASPDWSVGASEGNATGATNNFLLFDVPNVLETLHVELWERYHVGKDVLIGTAEVPLQQIARPEHARTDNPNPRMRSYRVDAWLPLRISADVAAGATKMHNQALSAVSALFHPSEWAEMSAAKKAKKVEEMRAKKEAEARKAAGKKGATAAAPTSASAEKAAPRIHVELTYSYSKMGEFLSHFTPPPAALKRKHKSARGPETEKQRVAREQRQQQRAAVRRNNPNAPASASNSDEDSDDDDDAEVAGEPEWESVSHASSDGSIEPFRLQTSYELLRRTIALLAPVYAFGAAVSRSMSPRTPLLWLLLTALCVVLSIEPWLVPVVVAGALARHMLWAYLYRRVQGGQPHVLDAEWQNYQARAMAAAAVAGQVPALSPNAGAARDRGSSVNKLVSALQLVNPLQLVTPFFGSKDKDGGASSSAEDHPDVATLERLLLPLLRHTLHGLGFGGEGGHSALTVVQARWSRAVDVLQSSRDALEWRGGGVLSSTLFLALCLATIFFYYFSPSYIIAIGQPKSHDRRSLLTLLVTRRTVLGGHAEWILLSTAAAVRESKIYKLYAGATSQKPKQA